jgi:hypothetical protein
MEFKLKRIIEAIDWWMDGGYNRPNTTAVGAIVQREAQRVLGVRGDMQFLRNEAQLRLEGIKLDRAMKQMSEKVQRELTDSLFKEFTYTKPKPLKTKPGTVMFPFTAMPFPTFNIKKRTRKEELEDMTYLEIQKLHRKASRKEIKRERIKYILESEKGDK